MYSYSSRDFSSAAVRTKRRQVKNACTNCQRACKKCDDARPCLRCVKYGISEECVDSQRKERKKGIKRGPYKKRDGKGSNVETPSGSAPVSNGSLQPNNTPPIMAPYLPIGYPPYIPYPPPDKSSDAPVVYSAPYFLAALPSAVHSQQDASPAEPPYSTQAFYQTAIYHHPSYLMPRNNAPHSYPVYLTPMLHKASNEATADESVNAQH
ncbi:hypothetical protein H1R20_g16171, partial [Candolleomyces eurysporus]